MDNQLVILGSKFDRNRNPIQYTKSKLLLRSINKPSYGFWTSTLYINEEGLITSEWNDFTNYNYTSVSLASNKDYIAYKIIPKKNIKVYEITEDKELDFDEIFKNYDGIHLSSEAAIKFHYGCFNSWDVESTVWCNLDWIESIEEISRDKISLEY